MRGRGRRCPGPAREGNSPRPRGSGPERKEGACAPAGAGGLSSPPSGPGRAFRLLLISRRLRVSGTVILQDGSQMRAKAFLETRDYSQLTTAATVQDTAKPVLQPANQAPPQTLAARLVDGHITSQIASTMKTPTDTRVTAKSTAATSPVIHTLVTTQHTPDHSHTAAPVTEATVGPSSAPHSQPATITPPAHTARTSSSTISHTTRNATQPSNQTILPATLPTTPRKSTGSQKPIQTTHAPGTTAATQSTTGTAPPVSTIPAPTLAPQPTSAKTGTYQVLNGSRLCIKAEMGIQLIVQDKESVFSPRRYFNIDPNITQASGNCGTRKSNLLLNFQGGFVNFTFTKDEKSYYISEVGAYLTVSDPVDECPSDYTVVLPVIGAIVVGLCLMGMGVYKIRLRCQSSGYQRI
uniref:lysosome-associated membrane glycoprotein 3 isoform X6 n=1 Tax=Callithrix jacchus TaxID=9483 RepID=UPI0023DD5A60|nr:lysosome-associated membrane glycoprotein 3 isoform X6 [Callithrix jacchus]